MKFFTFFFINLELIHLMGCSQSTQTISPQFTAKIDQILNFNQQSAESIHEKNLFSRLLNSIEEQIKNNPEYDSLLDRSLPLKVLNELNSSYVSSQSASTLISIVLDYMALCKKQYGGPNQLKTTFQAANVATKFAEKYEKQSNNIYFNNKDILKILAYICRLDKYPSNFVTHCYLDLKFDFDMQEIRKVAAVVKQMFSFDLRSFFYLTNYLYKSCLNLEKRGKTLKEIQSTLLKALNTLAEENPPAQPLKGQESLFNAHPNFLIEKSQLNQPTLHFTQEDKKLKMAELDQFIQERVKQSKKHFPKFSSSLKDICEKEGFHFKSGVKVKDISQKKALERVKQKLIDKNFSRYSVDDYLKSAPSKQSLEDFTKVEHDLYQQQIINMFDRIKDKIEFGVSDMLRGKCMYSDVQMINNTCTEIKNMYQNSDCKIVEIDNRLLGKTNTSDLVMKIMFGSTIAQLQLVINLNLASYEFSHKLYELMRSKFFSPLTMLKRFNEQLTEDLLDEYSIVIKQNSKNSLDFKQVITYADVKEKFLRLISLLPIPYKQKSNGAIITLQSIKAYEEELDKIKQVKVQKVQQNCLKFKANGDFQFKMKKYQLAIQNYEKYEEQWRKKYPSLLEKIEKKNSNLTSQQKKNLETFCESLSFKGISFQINGKYDLALSTFDRYMGINKDILKEKNKDAKVFMNIGFIYMKKHEGKKSEQYLKEALKIIEPIKGSNRWLHAEILNKYGMALKQQKRYQEALKYYNQSMELYLKLEGAEGNNYSALNNNIGIIYKNMGNYSQALKHLNNSLDIKEKTIGKLSNDYATTLKITGQVLADQGKTEESLKVYDRVKEIYLKIRGPQSTQFAYTLDNIGSSLQDLRKYDQSIEVYKESIRIKQKIFGENSINCSLTYNNIALLYTSKKDFKLAHEFLEKCLAIEIKVKGKGHIQTASTLCNIGALYKDEGKYQQAHKYYQQGLQIQQKHYGKDNAQIATTLNNIGLAYRLQNKYEEALKFYSRAKDIRQKVKGKNSMDYGLSMNNIAFVYSCQKNYTQAIKYMQVSQQIYESIKGKQSIQNIQKLQNLALWNRFSNNYEESIKLYQQCLAIRVKKGWINVVDYPNCISNVALCYLNLKKYDQAVKAYAESFVHFQRLNIKTDNFFMCKYNYGRCFEEKKEWKIALQQFLYCLPNFEEKKKPQLLNCLSKIESCYKELKDNENAEIYHKKIQVLKPS